MPSSPTRLSVMPACPLSSTQAGIQDVRLLRDSLCSNLVLTEN